MAAPRSRDRVRVEKGGDARRGEGRGLGRQSVPAAD